MKTETYIAEVKPRHTLDEELRPGVLHVCGDAEAQAYWYASLLCPCGCASPIYIPIAHGSARGWKLTIDGDRPTLPEVLGHLNGCNTRFTINGGRVERSNFQP